jgi:tetratricopeptide (TPR) repeat protein
MEKQKRMGFYFKGDFFPGRDATDIFVALFNALYEHNNAFFNTFENSRCNRKTWMRRIVAKNRKDLFKRSPKLTEKCSRQLSAGYWLNTNYSNEDKVEIIKDACIIAGLTYGHDVYVSFEGKTKTEIIDLSGSIPQDYKSASGFIDCEGNPVYAETATHGIYFCTACGGIAFWREPIDKTAHFYHRRWDPSCPNCCEKCGEWTIYGDDEPNEDYEKRWHEAISRLIANDNLNFLRYNSYAYKYLEKYCAELKSKSNREEYDDIIKTLEEIIKDGNNDDVNNIYRDKISNLILSGELHSLESDSNAYKYIEDYIARLENKQNKDQYKDIIEELKAILISIHNIEEEKICLAKATDYLCQDHYDEAIDHYNKTIVINAGNKYAYFGLGIAHFNKGENERAIANFDHYIRLNMNANDKHLAVCYYYRGQSFLKMNNLDKAIDDFYESLKIDAEYADVYYLRGYAYFRRNELDNALANFNKSLQHKESQNIHYWRGLTYLRKGDFGKAVQNLPQSPNVYKNLTPTDKLKLIEGYNKRGITCSRKDQIGAIKDFEEAIKINPNSAVIHNNLGTVYSDKGEYEKAHEEFKEATKLAELKKQNTASIHNNRGVAYLREGKEKKNESSDKAGNYFKKACEEFREAINKDQNFAEAYNNRAVVYHYQGNKDEAEKDFEKAIEINPDFWEAKENKRRLQRGPNEDTYEDFDDEEQ